MPVIPALQRQRTAPSWVHIDFQPGPLSEIVLKREDLKKKKAPSKQGTLHVILTLKRLRQGCGELKPSLRQLLGPGLCFGGRALA